MAAPEWADLLLTEIWADEGLPRRPFLVWRRSKPRRVATLMGVSVRSEKTSSGRAHPGEWPKIIITAGTSRRDQKLVLLHEAAHCLVPPREHHSRVFWEKAWDLFLRYGPARFGGVAVSPGFALKREETYRGMAIQVAIERGIRGSKTAKERRPAARKIPTVPCQVHAETGIVCPFDRGLRTHSHQEGTTVHVGPHEVTHWRKGR